METQQPLDAFGVTDDDDGDEFERAGGVYRWEPDGGSCQRCGDEADRLWRDGTREVCPSCKDW